MPIHMIIYFHSISHSLFNGTITCKLPFMIFSIIFLGLWENKLCCKLKFLNLKKDINESRKIKEIEEKNTSDIRPKRSYLDLQEVLSDGQQKYGRSF